jgi:hypothetical protein
MSNLSSSSRKPPGPRPVELIVAEHRDHDPAVRETVHRVRGGQLGLADDLLRLDDLVQLRFLRRFRIDDVDAAGDKSRDDEVAAGAFAVATGAGVPAEMVQLVADVRHRQPVNDLRIGFRLRVEIDGGEVVRLLDAGPCVDADDVRQLFGRRLDRVGGRGKGAPLAAVVGPQPPAGEGERSECRGGNELTAVHGLLLEGCKGSG